MNVLVVVKLACFWALEKSWYVYFLPSLNWFHGWADSNNTSSASLRSPLSFTNGYLLFEWCTIKGPLDGWTISWWKIICNVIAKWFGWTLGNKLLNSWVQCSNLAVIRPWVRILPSAILICTKITLWARKRGQGWDIPKLCSGEFFLPYEDFVAFHLKTFITMESIFHLIAYLTKFLFK